MSLSAFVSCSCSGGGGTQALHIPTSCIYHTHNVCMLKQHMYNLDRRRAFNDALKGVEVRATTRRRVWRGVGERAMTRQRRSTMRRRVSKGLEGHARLSVAVTSAIFGA